MVDVPSSQHFIQWAWASMDPAVCGHHCSSPWWLLREDRGFTGAFAAVTVVTQSTNIKVTLTNRLCWLPDESSLCISRKTCSFSWVLSSSSPVSAGPYCPWNPFDALYMSGTELKDLCALSHFIGQFIWHPFTHLITIYGILLRESILIEC